MDRKEFLRACTGGLCACAAVVLPGAAKAADAPKEDWRLGFVKQRFAKLLETLSAKMDDAQLAASLEEMGKFCASQNDERIKVFAGDTDGYVKFVASQPQMSIARDDTRKVYTQTYSPGAQCFCPFVGAKTPGTMCDCSVGWAKHAWGVVLKMEPKVVLKESVLRGGKACTFEITAA
ncbi:MAG TPA: hypothetical protein VMU01_10535 [Rhizomicrobium sp.]|nr:hypothetical protein [Rhizomicrobium sp.]